MCLHWKLKIKKKKKCRITFIGEQKQMQITLSWLFFFQLHDRARAVWDSSLLPASLQRQTVRCCQVGRKQRDPLINLHLWLTCCREEKTKCFLGGHGVAPTVFSSAGSPLVYFTVHSHGILHLLALHWFCRRWSCSTKTQPEKTKRERKEEKRGDEWASAALPLCRGPAGFTQWIINKTNWSLQTQLDISVPCNECGVFKFCWN